MNLPNRLTLFRVFLVPLFVVFLLNEFKGLALFVFCLASFTDFLDGYIARKKNLITNFGKFMDPLADKLLVCSALICLTYMDKVNIFITLIIIAREFIISGVRLIAAEKGNVIAASYWGKFKTVSQMIGIIFCIITINFNWFPDINPIYSGAHISYLIFDVGRIIIMWIACALTVISLIDYLVKNRNIFKGEM
jgi:CDP-diacylglycerol--glycerol-3-phosphate 3-phosphatidyltransferase